MTAPGTIRTRGQRTDRDRTTVAGRSVADRSRAKARPARSSQRTAEPVRRGSDWDTDSTTRVGRSRTNAGARTSARTSTVGRSARRLGGSRVGSRQQVSVRGRRIIALERGNPQLTRRIALALTVFILGVVSVMALSAATTKQSFQIADAQSRSTTLDNELESLNRDVANAKSSANIAKEASEMGMVTPKQSGILEDRDGKVKETRPADAEGGKEVVDVNGNAKRRGATSDPNETSRVEGLHPNNPIVAGDSAPDVSASAPGNTSQSNGGLPYSGNSAGQAPAAAPAPAPAAPAPAPAPAPAAEAPAPAAR
ncbi:putative secreted protein [Corynebacterium jeikeium]|uniref:Uncharacterized protein n=1 Tax=Corynebacterium jeikeium (strain K411) TaxID=306537 RepID=Q4JWA2_CORJK|nr:hypothetical protein [Corynebacterium jeikeium]CAI36905.1 hypothetical protein jk0743 [Corynebacterium jeikeium K411]SUY85742.1 putative secreted protein [Corynebacterium jeikeium]